jgi:NADH-quinone oxidoreductase subunit D
LTNNHIFVKRTGNIGVLSKEMALSYGCTGPMLRASLDRTKGDPDWDLRKTEPYSGYEQYSFDVPLPPFDVAPRGTTIGDCWHRFYVRMLEVVQSIRLTEQAIEKYDALHAEGERVKSELAPEISRDPKGSAATRLAELMKTKYSHRVEPPRNLPAGECYVETECPRGQMGFHVVGRPSKENVPLRVRARSSCFCNLSVTGEICRGCLVADVPAIVGSIDVVMGEIDR